jgi:hypothetical protein
MPKDTPTTNALDLSCFDTVAASDRGAEVELVHLKTGEPTGIFFKVLGTDSQEWREHVNERANKRMLAQFRADRTRKELPAPTIEEATNDAIMLLTRCTIGWRTGDEPTVTLNGEKLPFNSANVVRIYTEFPAVRQQVDEFIGDITNFM